ncbi:siderophore-interacting protein [Mycetocola reblochoni]|uniref:Iron utilization protein n=2 Tax=Mycetocola reblochoni TaxID=331618 RepID=A0A1R4K8B5_9MICO|nr:siderophore-interacting protein [Mycetocola reblochoni]RLP67878.1 siderophore-interacting protein [Mycetocola reblochoni]SJN40362.1 Iron utilization protein [Mycetocola reblochoni REB411]
MTTPSPSPRRPGSQHLLTVTRTERLSPHLVRVHFSGGPAEVYGSLAASDAYMKLHFAVDGRTLTPPVDLVALREAEGPEALPVRRTYTLRSHSAETGELAIDFVVHGDEGVAGPWAASARPGDTLVASSPGGAYSPDPAADAHLLAGDESALPAIAAALERMDADATGVALIEVGGPDDRLPLRHPDGVELRWLFRGDAPAGTVHPVAEALAELDWPTGDVQVFAHGEREQMKAVRAIVASRGVDRARLSLSGYWAYGRSEDRFQAEKREPIGAV